MGARIARPALVTAFLGPLSAVGTAALVELERREPPLRLVIVPARLAATHSVPPFPLLASASRSASISASAARSASALGSSPLGALDLGAFLSALGFGSGF